MRADGSQIAAVSNIGALDWLYGWSPDGQQIAFASDRASTGDERALQIDVMHVDGSGLRQLTDLPCSATNPVWSPNGQHTMAATKNAAHVADVLIVDSDPLHDVLTRHHAEVRQMRSCRQSFLPPAEWDQAYTTFQGSEP